MVAAEKSGDTHDSTNNSSSQPTPRAPIPYSCGVPATESFDCGVLGCGLSELLHQAIHAFFGVGRRTIDGYTTPWSIAFHTFGHGHAPPRRTPFQSRHECPKAAVGPWSKDTIATHNTMARCGSIASLRNARRCMGARTWDPWSNPEVRDAQRAFNSFPGGRPRVDLGLGEFRRRYDVTDGWPWCLVMSRPWPDRASSLHVPATTRPRPAEMSFQPGTSSFPRSTPGERS